MQEYDRLSGKISISLLYLNSKHHIVWCEGEY